MTTQVEVREMVGRTLKALMEAPADVRHPKNKPGVNETIEDKFAQAYYKPDKRLG